MNTRHLLAPIVVEFDETATIENAERLKAFGRRALARDLLCNGDRVDMAGGQNADFLVAKRLPAMLLLQRHRR